MDTNIFFEPEHEMRAKAVCWRCPIREQCLSDCLRDETPTMRYGVFGGLSAADRGVNHHG
jgi:hypothetical protein